MEPEEAVALVIKEPRKYNKRQSKARRVPIRALIQQADEAAKAAEPHAILHSVTTLAPQLVPEIARDPTV